MSSGRKRSRPVHTIRRLVSLLVAALVIEYIVVPQLAGTRKALHLLGSVRPAWLVVGLVLQAGSILSYAQLTRSLLPRKSVPFPTMARITVATLGLSHVIPGGTVAGAGLGFRLLRDAGVSGSDAGFVLGTQSIGSAVVLNVLLWIGLVVTIPLHGFRPVYGLAALVGGVLLGLFGAGVIGLLRGRERAARIASAVAGRLPLVDGDTVAQGLRRFADQLSSVAEDRRLLIRLIGWAASAWLLDAACLWVFLAAFGARVTPDAVIVSHGLANVLAAVPVTPGGLGVTEAVLTVMVASFGVPRGIAILGVLAYRLAEFWAPIPAGGLAWLSLKVEGMADRRSRLRELRTATEQAVDAAPKVRDWAGSHGITLPARRES